MTKTSMVGIGLGLAGLGVAGYFGWKYYKELKASDSLAGLGETYPNDYNGRIAKAYYRRQVAMLGEQRRLRRV
jgi:hypothetical protein